MTAGHYLHPTSLANFRGPGIGFDINDSGQVTGHSQITGNSAEHAFLYDNGSMQDLGTLGGSNSAADAINASGQVVGRSEKEVGSIYSFAFLYDGVSMLDLCVLVGCVGAGWDFFEGAFGINDNGDITGLGYINGEARAFLISAVPVPASVWLFGSGLLGLVGVARKKTSNQQQEK